MAILGRPHPQVLAWEHDAVVDGISDFYEFDSNAPATWGSYHIPIVWEQVQHGRALDHRREKSEGDPWVATSILSYLRKGFFYLWDLRWLRMSGVTQRKPKLAMAFYGDRAVNERFRVALDNYKRGLPDRKRNAMFQGYTCNEILGSHAVKSGYFPQYTLDTLQTIKDGNKEPGDTMEAYLALCLLLHGEKGPDFWMDTIVAPSFPYVEAAYDRKKEEKDEWDRSRKEFDEFVAAETARTDALKKELAEERKRFKDAEKLKAMATDVQSDTAKSSLGKHKRPDDDVELPNKAPKDDSHSDSAKYDAVRTLETDNVTSAKENIPPSPQPNAVAAEPNASQLAKPTVPLDVAPSSTSGSAPTSEAGAAAATVSHADHSAVTSTSESTVAPASERGVTPAPSSTAPPAPGAAPASSPSKLVDPIPKGGARAAEPSTSVAGPVKACSGASTGPPLGNITSKVSSRKNL